ncbi:hypothetical protein DL240_08760 [Lujinxingia litoralis]|uniref:PPM-type phosphatase domain-containing protein n=1 Tax=Lujinxingia litoralis TaxID=2211119 RepID=A0A328C7C7_9DELT|nr:bifunctional serine/threonine-protein kinase/phosphatase [Lujinxingia litoralis]RAL22972.1 hypothetical protein DL240_08760 [Lujinxingia litoralis]
MPLSETVCPECGELTKDEEWCPRCERAVSDTTSAEVGFAEPGQTLDVVVHGEHFGHACHHEVMLVLRVEEVLEEFAARRVLVARALSALVNGEVLEGDDALAFVHPTYLIEETTRHRPPHDSWPTEVQTLVRAPVCVQQWGAHTRSVFVDNVGVSVGDLVDLMRRELEFDQVKAIFGSVAELFRKLHAAGWVHLGLTPWNVRVFDRGSEDGFPRLFLSSSLGQDFDAPVEALSGEALGPNPFEGRGETVLELTPLTFAEEDLADAGDTYDQGEASYEDHGFYQPTYESSSISDVIEDVEEEVAPEANLLKIESVLDGIDRLFRKGQIDDDIPVIPGFSAPELLSGKGSQDGESADVFALGMLLYFLVAGVVPPASLYTRYVPAIPPRNLRPGFPPGLQAVISRATRPHATERFDSVATMLTAFYEACQAIEARGRAHERAPAVVRLASDTHIGIGKRRRNPVNQDCVFSASSEDGRFALIVVADGVSTASYGSGDLASRALGEEAAQIWEDVLPTYLLDGRVDEVRIIQTILRRANHRIVDYVNRTYSPFRGSPHEVMGSTALVAVICDGVVTLASLGDSRVYLQRGAGLEQMTVDHNLWTLSILEGVSADHALAMSHSEALARCMGSFVIEDAQLVAVEPQPDLFRFRVIEGDSLLLTTDGLVDFGGANQLAAEDNILAIMQAEPDPALACLELILLANRGGGGDNIGLSIARFY